MAILKQQLELIGWMLPAGTVIPYAGATPPDGWLECGGQPVPILDYPELFAAFDTTNTPYGFGGLTFNLPDLRGRVAMGRNGVNGCNGGQLNADANSCRLGCPFGSCGRTIAWPGHSHSLGSHANNSFSLPNVYSATAGAHFHSYLYTTNSISSGSTRFRFASSGGSTSIGGILAGAAHGHTLSSNLIYGQPVSATIGPNTTGNAGASVTDAPIQPTMIINYIIKY